MPWEFRVMKKKDIFGDVEFAIYEVHFRDDGTIEGYSEMPSFPRGEDIERLKEDFERYSVALHKPILEYDTDNP